MTAVPDRPDLCKQACNHNYVYLFVCTIVKYQFNFSVFALKQVTKILSNKSISWELTQLQKNIFIACNSMSWWHVKINTCSVEIFYSKSKFCSLFPSIQIKKVHLKHCDIRINSVFYGYKHRDNVEPYQQLFLLAFEQHQKMN